MMPPLAAPDRERLVKIAGLFSSDQLGERAAAALAADRLLRTAGVAWADILTPPPARREAPRHGHQDHGEDVVEDALDFLDGVVLAARWPARFIADVRLQVRAGRRLSDRQAEKVQEIARAAGWRGGAA